MKKQIYVKPSMGVVDVQAVSLLADSGGVRSKDYGIGYGGVNSGEEEVE